MGSTTYVTSEENFELNVLPYIQEKSGKINESLFVMNPFEIYPCVLELIDFHKKIPNKVVIRFMYGLKHTKNSKEISDKLLESTKNDN